MMQDTQHVLSLGHPGTGAALYIMQPAIDAYEDRLRGGSTTVAPHWLRVAKRVKKGFNKVLSETVHAGARVAEKGVAGFVFGVVNPEAVAWAEAHAAELVTEMTLDAQAAVRTVIVEGFTAGITPRATAKTLRATLGLTERDALAVMRKQIADLADGYSASTAAARAESYAAKLTRARALTIARTETMRASNQGQQMLWNQAKAAGFLTDSQLKVWITTDPCPTCAEVDGEEVKLDDDFSIDGPPAHPNCRCTVGLA